MSKAILMKRASDRNLPAGEVSGWQIATILLVAVFEVKIDVTLNPCFTFPDKHGFCPFGVGVDVTKSATEVAKVVIAQVNHSMPRSLGDSFIHVTKIHKLVEVDAPIMELPQW